MKISPEAIPPGFAAEVVPSDPRQVVFINLTDFKSVLLENIKVYCNCVCKQNSCKGCILEKFRLFVSRHNPIDLYKSTFPNYISVLREDSKPLDKYAQKAVEVCENLSIMSVLPRESILSLMGEGPKTLLDE